MRAFVVSSPKSADFTEDWTLPPPGPDELRIKVSVCGLNFADLLMIGGTYQETPPLPFVPGLEIAGTILAMGERVEGFAIVGHQRVTRSQEVGQGFEQGRFLARVTHEELKQAEDTS